MQKADLQDFRIPIEVCLSSSVVFFNNNPNLRKPILNALNIDVNHH